MFKMLNVTRNTIILMNRIKVDIAWFKDEDDV
jgi:hypothetical protein